ncbi:MarR family winged helix-turn-helix transcriptional regulator [Massilia sp. BSC265]|uniref:MarR family winged helix-turn-helix transcriptional regulator n=1 Tax=Massilia sp. BSC265 TaxID=1549812 RepID=UPI0004E8A4E5|nr:MarR family winged helix-turn-helix transcriptional regulator [Massilia sp. BSC265]KFI06888.1 MarR family transcriptional regulator [Massilia sp. BSC265]
MQQAKSATRPRFVHLLNRAQRALQRWIEARPESWEGISAAQVGLLFVLQARGDAAVGEIAAELGVAPAAVTNLSKRMQAAGMVERVADARDARLTRLQMTGAGRDAGERAGEVLLELNARLTEGFTPDELQLVARWLSQAAALEPCPPRD